MEGPKSKKQQVLRGNTKQKVGCKEKQEQVRIKNLIYNKKHRLRCNKMQQHATNNKKKQELRCNKKKLEKKQKTIRRNKKQQATRGNKKQQATRRNKKQEKHYLHSKIFF